MEDLIVNGEQAPSKVPEATVSFRTLSDLGIYEVRSEKAEQPIFEISGYGLKMSFNMQYLNSVEDIENLLEGIKELFRGIIIEQVMENKRRMNEEA